MRAGGAGVVDEARGTPPDAAGIAWLVEARGGGSDVLLGGIGGGGVGAVREGFARAADRERVLSEIR